MLVTSIFSFSHNVSTLIIRDKNHHLSNIKFVVCKCLKIWLVVLGFNATHSYNNVIIMAVGDAHVFPGFLTPVLTQLFFPKPPTTFLTCFSRGERRKYAGKKVRLNHGSNRHNHQVMSQTRSPLSHTGFKIWTRPKIL